MVGLTGGVFEQIFSDSSGLFEYSVDTSSIATLTMGISGLLSRGCVSERTGAQLRARHCFVVTESEGLYTLLQHSASTIRKYALIEHSGSFVDINVALQFVLGMIEAASQHIRLVVESEKLRHCYESHSMSIQWSLTSDSKRWNYNCGVRVEEEVTGSESAEVRIRRETMVKRVTALAVRSVSKSRGCGEAEHSACDEDSAFCVVVHMIAKAHRKRGDDIRVSRGLGQLERLLELWQRLMAEGRFREYVGCIVVGERGRLTLPCGIVGLRRRLKLRQGAIADGRQLEWKHS
ncbi:hypothetical protein Tco_0770365 [Tanacetum coccineum]|uniref:Uncharacterized protein n=1 Tax=Tanacetum coccineum TaxID=301880 RepID=A0ABQ4ZC02_9ASTR